MNITRLAASAAVAAFLGTASLHAQSVLFQGTTTGCFGNTALALPKCGTATSPVALDQFLVFTGGSFSQLSSNSDPGFTAIGSTTSNFGAFWLAGLPSSYNDDVFRLAIRFANPTNVSPDVVFDAVLDGSVSWRGDGGVDIDFDDAGKMFTFNGPQYTGSFNLVINDLSVDPARLFGDNAPVPVTGYIVSHVSSVSNVTATPEPATVGLVATGFIGLVPVVRRRRKKPAIL